MIKWKKIAMIGAYPPAHSGGVATHIYELSKELSKYNMIKVITTDREEKCWNDSQVQIHQEQLWYPHRYTTLQNMFQTTKRAYLLRKNTDLCHAHGFFYSGIGFLDKQKPIVLTVHGYASLETVSRGRIKPNSIQFKFMRWIEKKAVERADAIIAVDKRIYDWIINELNGDTEKVFHIPNGVDIEKFHPDLNGSKIRGEYHLESKPLILFVKALSPKNGPSVAVKAMKEIIKVYPEATLLIVGDGSLKGKLLNFTKELKIEKNIIFCGMKSNNEAPYYYAASDIIVVPSVRIAGVEEATSITMLEGMASGKPVVASNIGGLKEIIGGSDDRIGVLFDEGDHKDMAEKVIHLLDNKSVRTEIGKNAREYVGSKHTWEKVVEEISKVYQYALDTHKNRGSLN
ncbi:MAG: glycosyltransferase family 4 protein [Thermoplasmatales archaeon]|nr:glycosyltransferase family 4 protein [Thermoplasmatales archaeon]